MSIFDTDRSGTIGFNEVRSDPNRLLRAAYASFLVLWTLEIHQGLARCLQALRQGPLWFN